MFARLAVVALLGETYYRMSMHSMLMLVIRKSYQGG